MTNPEMDLSDLGSVSPTAFAQLIKNAPEAQMKEVMGSEHRDRVLGEIFKRMQDQLRQDKAGKRTAVIHWQIGGRPDGGTDSYETVIENGTCTATDKPARDPDATLTLGAVEFLKLVSGNANPVMMFMTGKVKIKGDLGLAANLTNLFDIPKA